MDKFLGDNWENHVKQLLDQAMRVCIATAYIDMAGIKILKEFLNNLPNKGSRRFNFLLDKDFHEDENAKEVIINELLDLPNTEVRIFDQPTQFFHSKLYIFYSGNEANVLVGSLNTTRAGLSHNIETGILTTNPSVAVKAKQFFNNYWRKSKVAEFTKDAIYIPKKFGPGDRIKRINTGETGLITSAKPNLVNQEWTYEVFCGRGSDYCLESDLVPYKVDVLADVFQNETSQMADKYDFLKNLLFFKLAEASDKNFFAYQSSRTDCNYYQFKPLMQMLRSPKSRILIADEVGLGKTIEAGIILSEYRSRIPKMNKFLVICPKSLQIKWKNELEGRFDEFFDIVDKRSMLTFVNEYKKNSDQASIFGIASYGLLRSKDVMHALAQGKVRLDFVIMDEAHYFRNVSTKIHQATRIVGHNTSILVMLTATPIQLGNFDLLHLLQILDAETFMPMKDNDFADYLNPNKYFTACLKALDQDNYDQIPKFLQEMMEFRPYRLRFENNPHYRFVLERIAEGDINLEAKGLIRRSLYNLNTLNQYVTRTRKSDVGYFNQREVKTLEYQYTDSERVIYRNVLEACKQKFQDSSGKKRKASAFFYIMPERQASSCLPAYLKDSGVIESPAQVFSDADEEFETEDFEGDPAELAAVVVEVGEQLENWRDSKYKTLASYVGKVIEEEKKHNIAPKFVIFSFFRATIRYLTKMLNEDFGGGQKVALVLDGSVEDIGERERIVNEFENNDKITFLICSEVASEGIDMHRKCHRLINYDLPWNPMKVEQRIGRIDRYGQPADKVFVVNLVCKDTIEDQIYAKLYERVTVFENSLGPLEAVLGQIEKQIVKEMLHPNKSEAEKEKFYKKIQENLVASEREEKKFEAKRIELLGLDEHFNQEISSLNSNRKYFTEEEVQTILTIFLDSKGPGNRLIPIEDKKYNLYFSPEVKEGLAQEITCELETSPRKLQKYLDLINSEQPILCTFNNDAAKDLKLVYITIHNPIIKTILRIWQVEGRFERAANILIHTDDIPVGTYAFFSNYIKFAKGRLDPNVQIFNIGISLDAGLEIPELGEHLYQHILTGDFGILEGDHGITHDQALLLKTKVQQLIDQYVEKEVTRLRDVYSSFVEAQLESLEVTKNQKISELKVRQRATLDQRLRDQYDNEIQRVEEEFEATGQVLREVNDFSIVANTIAQAICVVKGVKDCGEE